VRSRKEARRKGKSLFKEREGLRGVYKECENRRMKNPGVQENKEIN